MKYEEIKIGDRYGLGIFEVKVISKSDEYKIITTIDSDNRPTSWSEEGLGYLQPIKEELPEEGLLVSKAGSLVYKLSDGSGYGFACGNQSKYFSNGWEFLDGYWQPATPEQEDKFIEMLKKECEKRGLFEDTKIESHADGSPLYNPDHMGVAPIFSITECNNKNGQIFYKGKFAKPLKEDLLDKVTEVVNEFGNHIIEQTESGVILISKIK